MDRAVVLLPLTGEEPRSRLDCALERLVAAADEAAAAGLPTTVLLVPTATTTRVGPVLASWAPLVALVDDVDVALVVVPPAAPPTASAPAASPAAGDRRGTWWTAGLREAAARCPAPSRTAVLTTTTGTAVGTDWITGHARHLRAGASAVTGPVHGGGAVHAAAENLAVRLDVALAAATGGTWTGGTWTGGAPPTTDLVHATDPGVRSLRLVAPAPS